MKHLTRLSLVLSVALANLLQAEIRTFDQATTEALGVAIHAQDIRAAVANSLLLAEKIDPVKEGLRGWIIGRDKDAMLFRFVRERDGVLEAFYDVKFVGPEKPTIEKPADTHLSEAQLAQFAARTLAVQAVKQPGYNFVLLPDPQRSDAYLVYALRTPADENTVAVDGHYRFTISRDGKRIEQTDELFKSGEPLTTLAKTFASAPKIKRKVLTMTSPLASLPLETHVYLSLLHQMTFFVGTADGHFWQVQSGKIGPIK